MTMAGDYHIVAYEWIESSLQGLAQLVGNRLKEIAFSSEAITADLPDLISRIRQGIPPNEKGLFPSTVAIDWRSAILAGWLVKLGSFPSTPTKDEEAESTTKITRTERLTLKAVEYVILQNQYADAKTASFL